MPPPAAKESRVDELAEMGLLIGVTPPSVKPPPPLDKELSVDLPEIVLLLIVPSPRALMPPPLANLLPVAEFPEMMLPMTIASRSSPLRIPAPWKWCSGRCSAPGV